MSEERWFSARGYHHRLALLERADQYDHDTPEDLRRKLAALGDRFEEARVFLRARLALTMRSEP